MKHLHQKGGCGGSMYDPESSRMDVTLSLFTVIIKPKSTHLQFIPLTICHVFFTLSVVTFQLAYTE